MKKRIDNKSKDRIREILKEAYEFGYFIGYKGHSEWIKWVSNKKEEIYKKAKELGIYEAAKKAYQQGKEDGKQRRTEELNLMLIEKGRIIQEEQETKIVPTREEAEKEVLEKEFQTFLKSTKIIELPRLLELVKFLKGLSVLNPFEED